VRIAHLVGRVDTEASGPSYSVSRLCEGLGRLGSRVTLHTMEASEGDAPRSYELMVHERNRMGRRFWASSALNRALREDAMRADVLHNHGLWIAANGYAVAAVLGTKCRLVTSPRGTLSRAALSHSKLAKRTAWHAGHRRVVQDACFLHATGPGELEDIRSLGLKNPVAVIPNGVDIPEEREGRDERDGGLRELIFVGRLHPIKGLDVLLRAWRNVQGEARNWRLRLVGPDERGYESVLKRLSGSLGCERVVFGGPAFGSEKSRAYFRARLFILPSKSENFGMAAAEALAHGVPAVISKGAPWKGVEENGCGWWVEASVDSLTECLKNSLATSPEELKEMGTRGRSWMMREFSWERISRMMLDTYSWAIHGGEAPLWVSS
jgi:glycosyltransferase involved in cell wall biosynthesis